MSKICVLGLGYIGLPTATLLASVGHEVTGVDINQKVVDFTNRGLLHIIEPGLDEIFSDVIKKGKLKASLKPEKAEFFIIAVPTPCKNNKDDIPHPNIDYVIEAAKSIASLLKSGDTVIIESTCPVGTTELVAKELMKTSNLREDEINIAYCPERVIPGKLMKELISNDRIIGGLNSKATKKVIKFYSTFCKGNLLTTNTRTAELAKLAENAYRDINIAFANELSIVCDKLEIDVNELIQLSNHHPRVNILNPGCGVGGHCIAIDPWFIVEDAKECTPLIQNGRKVNQYKAVWVVEKIMTVSKKLSENIDHPLTIGCLGLAYKPDINDLRESPALYIVNKLINQDIKILVCEPNIEEHSTIKLCSLSYIIEKADLLVFLVGHSIFRGIDLQEKEYLDFCGITYSS